MNTDFRLNRRRITLGCTAGVAVAIGWTLAFTGVSNSDSLR
jgi:hypothetical protein